MTHPSSLDLETYACGDEPSAHVLAHIDDCEACGAFVKELRGLVAAGPSAKEAEAVVAALVAAEGADDSPNVELASILSPAPQGSAPSTLPATAASEPARAPHPARPDGRRRLWLVATSVVAPLAAAAAILLLVRSNPVPAPAEPLNPPAPPATAKTSGPYRIQMGTAPGVEPDTTFKGGLQIAVIRERGSQQTRFSSTVKVKPGDRLRVEVALDREQAILGAVLADDGSYLELMPEGIRGAGTYFSERSAKIDGTPTRGTIIIGSPEEVARARATKQLDRVTTLHVELEP
jgi:hypothetical protein